MEYGYYCSAYSPSICVTINIVRISKLHVSDCLGKRVSINRVFNRIIIQTCITSKQSNQFFSTMSFDYVRRKKPVSCNPADWIKTLFICYLGLKIMYTVNCLKTELLLNLSGWYLT